MSISYWLSFVLFWFLKIGFVAGLFITYRHVRRNYRLISRKDFFWYQNEIEKKNKEIKELKAEIKKIREAKRLKPGSLSENVKGLYVPSNPNYNLVSATPTVVLPRRNGKRTVERKTYRWNDSESEWEVTQTESLDVREEEVQDWKEFDRQTRQGVVHYATKDTVIA